MLFTAYYENDFHQLDTIDDYVAVESIEAPTWPIALERALLIGIARRIELDSLSRES